MAYYAQGSTPPYLWKKPGKWWLPIWPGYTGIDLCQNWVHGDDCIRLVDYWQDEDSVDWKVKGYTDGHTIAVLYVKNINEISVEKQDEFLDSFSIAK